MNLARLFDSYSLRARVYPGLLACLPIATAVILLWPHAGLKALWPVIVLVGGTFFLANYVRSKGRRLETELIAKWDGLPTTHLLRYREISNPVVFRRRRAGLERVFGEAMPSPEEEVADPAAADAVYVAATKSLISKVRGDIERYARVHEENIHYGFRRNLLALKKLGLVVLALCTVGAVAESIVQFKTSEVIVLISDLLIGVAWVGVVTEAWVREAGDTYAERLFETLEQDGLVS